MLIIQFQMDKCITLSMFVMQVFLGFSNMTRVDFLVQSQLHQGYQNKYPLSMTKSEQPVMLHN